MTRIQIFILFIFCSITYGQNPNADFKSVLGTVRVNTIYKSVSGKVTFDVEVVKPLDTLRIEANNMNITSLAVDGYAANSQHTGKQLRVIQHLEKGNHQVSFNYMGQPKQGMYFFGSYEKDDLQIWTQGQGKNTSNWFPSFDDANEKLIFNLDITFERSYQVISNGLLEDKVENGGELTWKYRMKNPMSSYLLMLAIGKFEKETITSNSGVPILMYIDSKDKTTKFEPTYRYTKEIFDFLEEEIGVPYPWERYQEIPVNDFLYAGMENTSATLFSRDFVVDTIGYNDFKYVNVNAHELAHQWFGNLVTAKTGVHHWLQEGFATYYALLAERKIFGDDYFYANLNESAKVIYNASQKDTIPLLSLKASTVSYYQKGAWMLHIIRETIGDQKFKLAIKNYLTKYAYQNVTTDDFLNEVKAVSSINTDEFRKKWLETNEFDYEIVKKLLEKNKSIKLSFKLQKERKEPFPKKKKLLFEIMQSDAYYTLKQEVIIQLKNVPFEDCKDLIRLGMKTNNVYIRQEIIKNIDVIPNDFKEEYKTFLNDESYITQELAFGHWWKQFPQERFKLLDQFKTTYGLNDKNIRTLWLYLALQTKGYNPKEKPNYYDELLDYSSEKFESSVRQNAFEYLFMLDPNDENLLIPITKALTYPKTQLSKYAKDRVKEMLKSEKHKAYFDKKLPNLTVPEQAIIRKLMEAK